MSESMPLSAETLSALREGRDQAPRALWLRVPGLLIFALRFVRELILANITMAKVVLFQKTDQLAPDFLNYDTTGLTPFEIVVLTHCITLTPGTTSVELSDDEKSVVVHSLDARDPAGVCLGIKTSLEKPLLGWTR